MRLRAAVCAPFFFVLSSCGSSDAPAPSNQVAGFGAFGGFGGSSATGAGAGGASGAAGMVIGVAGGGGTLAAGTGGGVAGTTAAGSGGTAGSAGTSAPPAEKFSFFVTSLEAMIELSGSQQGFGGDLRYGGKTVGIEGADEICATIAEKSMPGARAKGWHAYLSTAKGGANDGPIHAKERIGPGPWYDRTGRLVAMDQTALLQSRPSGADAAIRDDLPNETGAPNHGGPNIDNHDVVTATAADGTYDGGNTCEDWTSAPALEAGTGGFGGGGHDGPRVGHSWPAMSGQSWSTTHGAPGCAPSVALAQTGPGSGNGIGNGGGYGGIYCFARTP